MFKRLLFITAGLMTTFSMVSAQPKTVKSIPSSYFIDKAEIQLSEAINQFRTKNGMGELQLSPSLSYVAKIHLDDIRLNAKDEHGCNLNSWSDKGKWTPCCFSANQTNLDGMTKKPAEIAGFKGKGYETVVAAGKGVNSKNLIERWLSSKAVQEMVLGNGKWKDRNWQSVGVSILGGYASIWVSEIPDRITSIPLKQEKENKPTLADEGGKQPEKAAKVKEAEQPVMASAGPAKKTTTTRGGEKGTDAGIVSTGAKLEKGSIENGVVKEKATSQDEEKTRLEKGTNYFLVHSSYTSLKEAVTAFESLKKKGFQNLLMIDARGKYRVALGIYTTEAAAKAALRKNAAQFDEMKIYNF